MATKQTVEERQQQIEELAVKEKEKTITREEKVLLSELREAERRRKKNLLMAKERKALAQGKKDALNKILDSVGIKTENELKDVLRFVMNTNPELIPKMPELGNKEDEKPAEADAGHHAESKDVKPKEAKLIKKTANKEAETTKNYNSPKSEKPSENKKEEKGKQQDYTSLLEKARAEFAKRNPGGFAAADRGKKDDGRSV